LDVKKGLERYGGDEAVYLSILRKYVAVNRELLKTMNDPIEETIDDFRIKVYGIKGASYEIFGNQTGDFAKALEDACIRGDLDFVREFNPYFMENATALIDNIQKYISSFDEIKQTIEKDKIDDDLLMLKAACTLPLAGKPVKVNGIKYFDGGVTTMIPIGESIKNGCDKHIVVTTKPSSFVRKPTGGFTKFLVGLKYPRLAKDLETRTDNYYKELETVQQLKADGKCIHLHPNIDLGIKRFSGDKDKRYNYSIWFSKSASIGHSALQCFSRATRKDLLMYNFMKGSSIFPIPRKPILNSCLI
jgi:hypothetical protein